MLISLKEILNRYNLHPKGVIHVGGHWAEEHEDYLKCGIERFIYIEPCKEAMEVLVSKFKHDLSVGLIQCACGEKEETAGMYVSHQNEGQSNSLLKPMGHLTQHPEVIFDDVEVVTVSPLDSLPIEKGKYDLLVMDVQGAEGMVLKGAIETLKYIKVIYSEVNNGNTYEGCMQIDEMDEFLREHGFVRMETYWPSATWTWGDAIYIKR